MELYHCPRIPPGWYGRFCRDILLQISWEPKGDPPNTNTLKTIGFPYQSLIGALFLAVASLHSHENSRGWVDQLFQLSILMFWVHWNWCTLPKFNSSPLTKWPKPNRKPACPPFPPFFRGEVLNFGGCIVFSSKFHGNPRDPPNANTPKKALFRDYEPLVSLTKAFLALFLGGVSLDSHENSCKFRSPILGVEGLFQAFFFTLRFFIILSSTSTSFTLVGTPKKINMERENDTLVWDNHLPNLHFGVPAVNFPGCSSNFQLFDEILLLDPNFLLNRRAPSAQKVAGRFLNLENTKNHAKVRISLPVPLQMPPGKPPERRTLAGRIKGLWRFKPIIVPWWFSEIKPAKWICCTWWFLINSVGFLEDS